MLILSFALMFISAVCLVFMVAPSVNDALEQRQIRQRVLAEVTTQENRPTLLSQVADWMMVINRWLPTGWYAQHVTRKLEAAGLKIAPMQFLVIQEIGLITGGLIYFVMMGKSLNLGWLLVFLFMGIWVPMLWLTNRIQQRRQSISRDLPEVVDLLSLCIDAGIDFMNALIRIVKEFRPCPTVEELGIVIQEVRVGKRRRDALRAFSTRVQTPESSSFARTLIQADRMGTGIAEALRILSEDMRIQRYSWAERFAQQAPLKMLLPLLLSLFAALIIVGGPIMIQFLNGGFNISTIGGSGLK